MTSDPLADWEKYWSEANATPDWVKSRQIAALDKLHFQAPQRSHAQPLNPVIIAGALRAIGEVISIRELTGLDVWFVNVIRNNGVWDVILYEHMGEWKCSSITERKG